MSIILYKILLQSSWFILLRFKQQMLISRTHRRFGIFISLVLTASPDRWIPSQKEHKMFVFGPGFELAFELALFLEVLALEVLI